MFSACGDWQELLTIAVLAYLGPGDAPPRRCASGTSTSSVARCGSRRRAARLSSSLCPTSSSRSFARPGSPAKSRPDEYVIPNRRPASVRRRERSPKVIWEKVPRVPARAKVRSHAHALRAAFAVRFDEAHPDQLLALKTSWVTPGSRRRLSISGGARSSSQWSVCATFRGGAWAASCYSRMR
jgi:hypothetical protein